MLYVSKILSRSKICITDSDDGVEDILGASELIKYVRDLGVHIEGIKLVKRADRYAVYADVRQPPDTVTARQAKSIILSGVNIVSTGGLISSIKWSKDSRVEGPVSIRLSDFGSKCADYLFWWEGLCRYPNLTLVFDDKIEISSKSLKRIDEVGIVSDVSGVVNNKLAETVYKSYTTQKAGCALNLIIDNPERFRIKKAMNFLSYGKIGVSDAQDIFYDKELTAQLASKLISEFRSLSKCQFIWNAKVAEFVGYMTCKRYARDIAASCFDVRSFDRLRDCCAEQLRAILSTYTMCNSVAVFRFCNFVYNFKFVPKEVKDIWVDFCSRANRWLLLEVETGELR